MCKNESCTLKDNCYRATVEPSEFRQSFSSFKQVKGKCDYYWPNENTSQMKLYANKYKTI